MNGLKSFVALGIGLLLLAGCGKQAEEEIHVGFIGPLTGNAVDLGVGPAKAMELAVKEYNAARADGQPRVVLHVEDDEWVGKNALPLYDKLRKEHGIKVLLLSHTDGTIALQDRVIADGTVMINSLNNDEFLAGTNDNTFVIGKKTEEAAQLVAGRAIELGLKKVRGFHVTNSFMTIFADSFAEQASRLGLDAKIEAVDINRSDYTESLKAFRDEGCDALVFFGYRNLGYAMKQARALGMDAAFFGATTLLGDGFYENAEGAMAGTEFSFFTENDGNYVLANRFLENYRQEFGQDPFSIWPAMQAYDSMNMALAVLGRLEEKPDSKSFDAWFAEEMHAFKYYQGVCGNIAIQDDGTSRGIYFSLYTVVDNGVVKKVRR